MCAGEKRTSFENCNAFAIVNFAMETVKRFYICAIDIMTIKIF